MKRGYDTSLSGVVLCACVALTRMFQGSGGIEEDDSHAQTGAIEKMAATNRCDLSRDTAALRARTVTRAINHRATNWQQAIRATNERQRPHVGLRVLSYFPEYKELTSRTVGF